MYIFGDEIIKPIKDFENYGISNKGYVYKNLKYGLMEINYKNHRVNMYKNKTGLLFVRLSENGKTKTAYIHKLVAEYFLENPHGFRKVIHIDGNKENNHVDNLRWVPDKKYLEKKISELKEKGLSIKDISKRLNISSSSVREILKDKKILTVYLSEKNYRKILDISKRENKSVSKVINEIIENL